MLPHDTFANVKKQIALCAVLQCSNTMAEAKMGLRVWIEQWFDEYNHLYERTWYFTKWRRVWKTSEHRRYMQAVAMWRKLRYLKASSTNAMCTLKYAVYSKLYKPWSKKQQVSRRSIFFHK